MSSYHPNFQRPRWRVSVGAQDKIKPGVEELGLLDLVFDFSHQGEFRHICVRRGGCIAMWIDDTNKYHGQDGWIVS